MLIDDHGENVAMIAVQGEHEMREREDEKGATIWKRIIVTVVDADPLTAARAD